MRPLDESRKSVDHSCSSLPAVVGRLLDISFEQKKNVGCNRLCCCGVVAVARGLRSNSGGAQKMALEDGGLAGCPFPPLAPLPLQTSPMHLSD